jgi:GGDEF domain-containing protein
MKLMDGSWTAAANAKLLFALQLPFGSIARHKLLSQYGSSLGKEPIEAIPRSRSKKEMVQTDLLNQEELEKLERRGLQVTVLSVVFVLVLAGGLAMFMYPLVFEHPEGNKWTLRVAFFGFCGLTLLFVGYLLDQQKTLRHLKRQLLAEVERNIALKHQANVDLLGSMPDATQFFDRLTMEFRRAKTMEKTLSLVLLKVNPAKGTKPDMTAVCSAAAKGMSRRLRPTDSIFRLAPELFGVVLPETDKMNGKRVALRLQEELQAARTAFSVAFELSVYNYPEDVVSAHEMEDLVKSLMPEQPGWDLAAPATALAD